MKNIREMTPEQIFEIGRLALHDVHTFDKVAKFFKHTDNTSELKYMIEKSIWNDNPELMKIQIWLHGLGNTYACLWEVDNENRIDITLVENDDPADVSNLVLIVKKLIEWEFV